MSHPVYAVVGGAAIQKKHSTPAFLAVLRGRQAGLSLAPNRGGRGSA